MVATRKIEWEDIKNVLLLMHEKTPEGIGLDDDGTDIVIVDGVLNLCWFANELNRVVASFG